MTLRRIAQNAYDWYDLSANRFASPAGIIAAFALLAAFLLISAFGCNATGWEPGPHQGPDEADINVPGMGQTKFTGERDTTLTITGMRGVPGSSYPDMDSLILVRSASGPLSTRGGAQQAIELLRWQESRETARQWQEFAMSLAPIAMQYAPTWQQRQQAAASQPSRTDEIREILAILKAEGVLKGP